MEASAIHGQGASTGAVRLPSYRFLLHLRRGALHPRPILTSSITTIMRLSTNSADNGETDKATSEHQERSTGILDVEQMGVAQEFDIETSKVLRKIDWRLIPVLSFLYLLAFLVSRNA